MQLPTYTRQLSRDLQLEHELIANDEGAYQLEVAADFVISMNPLAEGFLLGVEIGPCKEEDHETLLLANLFGQGTGGAVLGLTGKGDRALVTQGFPYEMTYADFKEKLELFLNWAEFWKGELK